MTMMMMMLMMIMMMMINEERKEFTLEENVTVSSFIQSLAQQSFVCSNK